MSDWHHKVSCFISGSMSISFLVQCEKEKDLMLRKAIYS